MLASIEESNASSITKPFTNYALPIDSVKEDFNRPPTQHVSPVFNNPTSSVEHDDSYLLCRYTSQRSDWSQSSPAIRPLVKDVENEIDSEVTEYFVDEETGDLVLLATDYEDQDSIVFLEQSPCIADQNGDQLVDARDIALFMNAYTSKCIRADVDMDGDITPDDLDAYLLHFKSGC